MKVKAESPAGVALVAKAFQILDMFQIESPAWSQADLVRATGLNRSTVNRLVRFLASHGYLVQIGSSGQHTLGLAAIELGNRASAGFNLRKVCQPSMEALAAKINETVILSALDAANLAAVCVDQIEGRQEGLRVFESIGSRFPLHAGAAPKAILAFLPEDLQQEALNRDLKSYTDHTVVDRKAIEEALKLTRERGYAMSSEETFEGTMGIAAPILGPNRTAVASLAVALPITRAKPEACKVITDELVSIAAGVTRHINGGAT